MLLYSPSKCSFTLSKLIHNAWLFLLAARHRMQALYALACCVGCAFSGFASLKIALFIQLLTNEDDPKVFGSSSSRYCMDRRFLKNNYLFAFRSDIYATDRFLNLITFKIVEFYILFCIYIFYACCVVNLYCKCLCSTI